MMHQRESTSRMPPGLTLFVTVQECVAGKPCFATIALQNHAANSIQLQMGSCSYYENFETDSSIVRIGSWACFGNALQTHTIEPGKSLQLQLPLVFSGQPTNDLLAFKLTFHSMSEAGISEKVVSNPVQIQFTSNCPTHYNGVLPSVAP